MKQDAINHMMEGRYEEAILAWKKYISLPNCVFSPKEKIVSYINLAFCYTSSDLYQLADNTYVDIDKLIGYYYNYPPVDNSIKPAVDPLLLAYFFYGNALNLACQRQDQMALIWISGCLEAINLAPEPDLKLNRLVNSLIDTLSDTSYNRAIEGLSKAYYSEQG